MNQSPKITPSKPKPGVRKWLWTILIIVILSASGFFIYRRYFIKTATPIPSPSLALTSPSPSPIASVTSNPTANWKTYNDAKYGLSFKYPDNWSDPKLSSYDQPDPLYFVPIANDNLDFNPVHAGAKYYIQLIEISHLDDYKNTEGNLESYNKLLNVYNTKNASGADKLWMPHSNAAIIAAGPPVYIENNDGSYRGIYYFATIGQALTTNIDMVAILTNAKNVFQLHIAMKSDKSAQYEPTLETDPEKFNEYVEGLTTSSDETLVKEFNSIYQYIIKSVK